MSTNADRLKRVIKSGSATPIAVGAGIGVVVGLITGPVILFTAVGAAAGMAITRKKHWK